MIARGRGPIATARRGKPIPTMTRSARGYPLGFCRACCKIQEAGYCKHCGSSVDPFDKNIRWEPARGWLPSELDEPNKGAA